MGLVPGQNRRLESAISFLPLVILFLIALVVFRKLFDVDVSQLGIDTTVAGVSLQQMETGM